MNGEARQGMQVYGADGQLLGTIERVQRGQLRVAGQQIPESAVARVAQNRVYLRESAGQYLRQDATRVPVAEERLNVTTREVELGAVQLRKTVEETEQSVPVELRREEVHVERQDRDGRPVQPGEQIFQEETIRVPVRGEEPVVHKETVITGEVVVNKTPTTERQEVTDTVRREHVEPVGAATQVLGAPVRRPADQPPAPVSDSATPASTRTGEGLTRVDREETACSWLRPILVGAGTLTPLSALLLPGVRQAVFGAGRAGAGWLGNQALAVRTARARGRVRQQVRAPQEDQHLLETVTRLEGALAARPRRRSLGSRLRPFVLGTVLGGGLGLAYTPQSGEQTRALLRQRLGGVRERAAQLTGQATEQAALVRDQAQQTLGQVKERAQQTLSSAPSSTGGGAHRFASAIREHMHVFGVDDEMVGGVDHLDPGGTIKLTKDAAGQHHWIPLAWVARVDSHVHLNRPAQQIKQAWSTSAPQGQESADPDDARRSG